MGTKFHFIFLHVRLVMLKKEVHKITTRKACWKTLGCDDRQFLLAPLFKRNSKTFGTADGIPKFTLLDLMHRDNTIRVGHSLERLQTTKLTKPQIVLFGCSKKGRLQISASSQWDGCPVSQLSLGFKCSTTTKACGRNL